MLLLRRSSGLNRFNPSVTDLATGRGPNLAHHPYHVLRREKSGGVRVSKNFLLRLPREVGRGDEQTVFAASEPGNESRHILGSNVVGGVPLDLATEADLVVERRRQCERSAEVKAAIPRKARLLNIVDDVHLFEKRDDSSLERTGVQCDELLEDCSVGRVADGKLIGLRSDPWSPHFQSVEDSRSVTPPGAWLAFREVIDGLCQGTMMEPIDINEFLAKDRELKPIVPYWTSMVLKPGDVHSLDHAKAVEPNESHLAL